MDARRIATRALHLGLLAGACAGQSAEQNAATAKLAEQVAQGDALVQSGKPEEARAVLQAAWRTAQTVLFVNHVAVQESLWRLGSAAEAAGDHATAHEAFAAVAAYRERTLAADHPALRAARARLARVLSALGRAEEAGELFAQVLEGYARDPKADAREVADLRAQAALAQKQLGRWQEARALEERVLEARAQALADDDPLLQSARSALAETLAKLGEHRAAAELQRKVVEILSGTLPDDAPELLRARAALAASLVQLGDRRGAYPLHAQVFAALARTRPADDPELQSPALEVALGKRLLGDPIGALVLQERVLAARERALVDEDPALQEARAAVAATRVAIGDLAGARPLQERGLATAERTRADGALVRRARSELAATALALGDAAAALALQQQVLADLEGRAEDDAELQAARRALAATLRAQGDAGAALALEKQVLASRAQKLPDDHPDLQASRLAVARLLIARGKPAAALPLLERALAAGLRALPPGDPDLLRARCLASEAHAALGEAPAAVELAGQAADAGRHALATSLLAPRELRAAVRAAAPCLETLGRLIGGSGELPPQIELAEPLLLLAESARGIEARAAHALHRRLDDEQRARAAAAVRELEGVAAELAGLAGAPPAADDEAAHARDQRRRAAVAQRDVLQRELIALAEAARAIAFADLRAADLAARLPEHGAAVSITSHARDAAQQGGARELLAACLRRDGTLVVLPLGPLADVALLLEKTRAAAASGDADREAAGPHHAGAAWQLRRLLLDPILAELGEATTTVWVSLDPALRLAPLAALPDEDGAPIGARISLRPVPSLLELLEEAAPRDTAAPRLLALAAVDYEAEVGAPTPGADAALPPAGEAHPPLAATEAEALAIAELVAAADPKGEALLRLGADASKDALFAAAPRARWLHLATHAWSAPEGWPRDGALSPLVLCGLALAGADRPADALGRHAGRVSAAELARLDLSGCALAVLSACDPERDARHAAADFAALRSALNAAGARSVLAPLWRADDAATRELLVDFYRRVLAERQDPHTALAAAQAAARARGVPFRDWAGWMLTGP